MNHCYSSGRLLISLSTNHCPEGPTPDPLLPLVEDRKGRGYTNYRNKIRPDRTITRSHRRETRETQTPTPRALVKEPLKMTRKRTYLSERGRRRSTETLTLSCCDFGKKVCWYDAGEATERCREVNSETEVNTEL